MKGQTNDRDLSHSLTDLMAGVAAIFLLIAVVFILMAAKREEREDRERRQYQAQLRALEKLRQSVLVSLEALSAAISEDRDLREFVSIDEEARKKDPFMFVVVFDRTRLSFPPGGCELSQVQDAIVERAAPRVLGHVCRFAAELEAAVEKGGGATISMTLEGHTDRRPFLPAQPGCGVDVIACPMSARSERCERIGFENNVRLSGARAQSVFFSMQRAVAAVPEISACLERYFVVAGRGPVEPRDGRPWRSDHTDDEDERNRRVILEIRAQPSLESLTELPLGDLE
jgi:flagellar motor protein MotB